MLLGPLAEYDVHLLITVRDLGRQVPSAWQQRIQGRGIDTYEDYLDAVEHRAPAAADFWRNQDLPTSSPAGPPRSPPSGST